MYFRITESGRFYMQIRDQSKAKLEAGMAFRVEVLDTWGMTVTPVDGEFKVVANGPYRFRAEGGRAVKLPGRAYMALRIQRVH